jgi:hypothetical protein
MTTRKIKRSAAFHPHKYYAGLTRKQALTRKREIAKYGAKDWKDPAAYVGFKTDSYGQRRTSSYTMKWRRRFPEATSLKAKARASGVPLRFITDCYNRGLAAWRTGHRPGASEQQWGYARVHSFLMCGKTHYGPDSDLVRKAKRASRRARQWFKQCA